MNFILIFCIHGYRVCMKLTEKSVSEYCQSPLILLKCMEYKKQIHPTAI